MRSRRPSRRALLALLPAALVSGVLVGVSSAGSSSGPVRIATVSDRADLVSGGDALVRLTTPGASARAARVTLNGRNITRAFRAGSNAQGLGLVTGLRLGRNVL